MTTDSQTAAPAAPPRYRDPAAPLGERVEDLLGRMTLEEKIGQLNMPMPYDRDVLEAFDLGEPGHSYPCSIEDLEHVARGGFSAEVGPAGGCFALPFAIEGGPREQTELANRLQRIALEQTRLGVPLLFCAEGFHALMGEGGTIFPEGPGLGAAWDPALTEAVFAAIAREVRLTGGALACVAPIDPIRDPRIGRGAYWLTEDPHLLARLAQAMVRGGQGDDLAAPDRMAVCLLHYPAQSAGAGGLERGAMDVSPRTLADTYLPAWRAGLGPDGARSVMPTYVAIDGVPTHASAELLSATLRDDLGFDGVVLSEGLGFDSLLYEGVAATMREAGELALAAGVDVNISWETAYLTPLVEAVREGRVDEALVDRAVRRVLALKVRLGLFERPYADADAAARGVGSAPHCALALRAAQESVVLLKNEGGALPLRRDELRSIAVLGPHADAPRPWLGGYMSPRTGRPLPSLLDAIRAKVGAGVELLHAPGCSVLSAEESGIAAAVEAARAADVAVLVVGDAVSHPWLREPKGTIGEGSDVASLDLQGAQEQLVRAVHATGTPTAVVLVNGRALSIRWIAEHVPAIVEGWLGGERGPEAIADVLFGDVNPSGKLPMTFPAHVGQLPFTYDWKRSRAYAMGKPMFGWVDVQPGPLFSFGHGLSYTEFGYADLVVEQAPEEGVLARVRCAVWNAGERPGAEVVQLYVSDEVASVAVPEQLLRGFEKVRLEPGERRDLVFDLDAEALALIDASGRWVVEPGGFELRIGSSSADVRLRGRFELAERIAIEGWERVAVAGVQRG